MFWLYALACAVFLCFNAFFIYIYVVLLVVISLKNQLFINIVLSVQCSGATVGSCVKVTGTLVSSEHDRQAAEVKAEDIQLIGSCDLKVRLC